MKSGRRVRSGRRKRLAAIIDSHVVSSPPTSENGPALTLPSFSN